MLEKETMFLVAKRGLEKVKRYSVTVTSQTAALTKDAGKNGSLQHIFGGLHVWMTYGASTASTRVTPFKFFGILSMEKRFPIPFQFLDVRFIQWCVPSYYFSAVSDDFLSRPINA
jgi:hypothetical protein